MNTKVEKLPKSTIKLIVTVPNFNVRQEYEHVLDELVRNAEVPGFRKGTAPRDLIKEKTDVSKMYGKIINHLLEKYYPQALKENLISPIGNPQVEVKEFDLEKDFEFVAMIPTKPEVKVGNYKKLLKDAFEEKKKKISEENVEKLKKGEKIDTKKPALTPNEVIDGLLKTSETDISDILREEEANRLITRLVDQAQAVGLSLEQYLKAQNKTADQLKADYLNLAEKSLKAEFVLNHLIKVEGIAAEDKEVDDMINASGDEETKKKMQEPMQKWYIKNILEKNKLISKLIEEIEKE